MNYRSARLWLRSLLRRSVVERELSDELQFHLDRKIDELRAAGLPEAEARAQAAREFGNIALHKEECRDRRHMNPLDSLIQDLRYSARALARTPGFTALSICSLALGMGATSALFSIVDVALLHPVNLPGAARLVWLEEQRQDGQESGGNPERLRDWQTLPAFDAVAGFYGEAGVLTDRGTPVRLEGLRYIGPLEKVLGAGAQRGRMPSESEVLNGAGVMVLGDAAWAKYFSRDEHILGRALRISGKPYVVIGVLHASVQFPEATDFWAPMPREVQASKREAGFLAQAARLSPGASMETARSQAESLCTRLAQDHPATDAGRSLRLESLTDHVSRPARGPLTLFFGAALGVLLIACVNVAGLLLARGLNRQREASIRVALGAGRARLVRLFLAESLLLAVAGCGAGLMFAWAGLGVLKRALPEDTPRLSDAAIGWRVVLFGIGVATVSAALCGLIPAWRAALRAAAAGMKEGGRAGAGRSRLRSLLVVAQMALSLALLIAGGLLINSFLHLRGAPLGFEPQRAYGFAIPFPWDTPDSALEGTVRHVLDRLQALPGTQAAGVVDRLPLHGGAQSRRIIADGIELSPDQAEREVSWRMASEGFFPAAGIPLLSGSLYRAFRKEGPRECVISEALARQLFGGASPVGRQIAERPGRGGPKWLRIAGVVGNTRLKPSDSEPAPEIYLPWGADSWPILNFVVRGNQPPAAIARFVNREIRPLASGQIVEPVTSLEELTAATRASERTRAILAGTLAIVALLLCSLGLFGLLAHETVRRTREYGIRVTLGAKPASLAVSAVKTSLWLAGAGIAIGLGAAFGIARSLESMLYGVKATDAVTYALASLLLVIVALVASAAPALRAAKVDPMAALRHD